MHLNAVCTIGVNCLFAKTKKIGINIQTDANVNVLIYIVRFDISQNGVNIM